MFCSFFKGRAVTKTQAAALVVLMMVAVFTGVFIYLSYSKPGTNPSPSSPSITWNLRVDGFVQSPLNLTLDELMAMPRTTVNAELYCLPTPESSGVITEYGNWTGARLGLVLEAAGVSPEAVKVAFFAEDGFSTDLEITTAMREDIILAYEKDGEPLLPIDGGSPLRLIPPEMGGYKWIKWLLHIELKDYDFKGTYESQGWPDGAVDLGD